MTQNPGANTCKIIGHDLIGPESLIFLTFNCCYLAFFLGNDWIRDVQLDP